MEKTENIPDYRLWLYNEFTSRTNRNPRYSLRAFSHSLGISPASLSQIMSGKRPLSKKTAKKITERCLMSREQALEFFASGMNTTYSEDASSENQLFNQLSVESFRVLSDWYYYAILSLGDLEKNFYSPEWIASRLNIKPKEASEALKRLKKLQLIKREGKGFRLNGKPLSVPTLKENHAISRYHLQNLRKAEECLTSQTAKLELFSSMTMAIDETQLEEGRALIKNFRRKLCKQLEKGKRTRIYTLAVQLFPVSIEENPK